MPSCLRREGALLRLLLMVLLISCTTTITRTKQPVFSVSTDSLDVDLSRIVSCENINVGGKDIVTNGRDSTVLEIDIINGKSIPGYDSGMIPLARDIASKVKGALQDKDQYRSYAVIFLKRETTGAVTKSSWTGKVFSSDEISSARGE